MEKLKSIAEMSVDSQIILDLLLASQKGQVITYDQLSKLIGRDIRFHRGLLETARKHALNEKNFHFTTIRGVGIRRSDDEDKIVSSESRMRKIKTQTRKAIQELVSVDNYEELSKENQIRYNIGRSLYGALIQATSSKVRKSLESKVSEEHGKLPTAKTLELFKE